MWVEPVRRQMLHGPVTSRRSTHIISVNIPGETSGAPHSVFNQSTTQQLQISVAQMCFMTSLSRYHMHLGAGVNSRGAMRSTTWVHENQKQRRLPQEPDGEISAELVRSFKMIGK